EHGLDPIWNKPLGGHPFLIAGLEADAFLRKTRTSAKALAAVVAKNRKNALRNPLAAYAANVDAAQVLSSPERFTPLRALDIAAPPTAASCSSSRRRRPRSDVTRIRYGSAASDGRAIRRPARRAPGRRRRTPN